MRNPIGCCVPKGSFVPDMKNAVSGDGSKEALENYELLVSSGYDFMEGTSGLLSDFTENEYAFLCNEHKNGRFSVYAVNSLLPASLGLFVPGAEKAREEHIKKVFTRLKGLGGKYVIFGSGRARSTPDGYVKNGLIAEMCDFLSFCDGVAGKLGLTLLIEPLNSDETNLVTSLGEGFEYIEALGLKNIAMLCDIFHFHKENDSLSCLEKNIAKIKHIHLAEVKTRGCPSSAGGEFLTDFIKKVLSYGYAGGFSVECHFNDYLPEMKKTGEYLRSIIGV